MAKKYEYHKRNDYPGERVAERKRVADRADAATKKSDARVAEKGRTEGLKADKRVAEKGRTEGLKADKRVAEKGRTDELIADARVAQRGRIDDGVLGNEIELSTDRAAEVNRSRNSWDALGLFIGVGVIIVLLAGLGWSVLALQEQSDEIDSLNLQAANPNSVQLIGTDEEIQLYNNFLTLAADDKERAKDYLQFDSSYSDAYSYVDVHQICVDSIERSNKVNIALNSIADKEVENYRQINSLTERPQCKAKIDYLATAVASSKAADRSYYDLNMELCNNLNMRGTLKTDQMGAEWNLNMRNALNDATAKTKTVTNAEKDMFACFAS